MRSSHGVHRLSRALPKLLEGSKEVPTDGSFPQLPRQRGTLAWSAPTRQDLQFRGNLKSPASPPSDCLSPLDLQTFGPSERKTETETQAPIRMRPVGEGGTAKRSSKRTQSEIFRRTRSTACLPRRSETLMRMRTKYEIANVTIHSQRLFAFLSVAMQL